MLELQRGDFLEYCRSGMEVISHRERAIRFASSHRDVEGFLTSRDSGPRREPLSTVGYTSSYELGVSKVIVICPFFVNRNFCNGFGTSRV